MSVPVTSCGGDGTLSPCACLLRHRSSATHFVPGVDMPFRASSRGVLALTSVLILVLGACSNDPTPPDSSAAAPSTPSSKTLSTAPPPPPCPNPEGGSCLGVLRPGKPYTTVKFSPSITYEVPGTGWKNFEDLYGNFLLVPPGNDLEGVNAGTADYIGVYRGVLPSKLTSPQCGAEWPLGAKAGPTPDKMVSYYRTQRNLAVSGVHEAEIGGRSGVVLDLRAAPGVPLDHCLDGTTKVEVNQVISGIEGSSFDHGVINDMTMRLYLLRDGERVMGIEVTDIDAAPGTVDTMSRVVETLRFDG